MLQTFLIIIVLAVLVVLLKPLLKKIIAQSPLLKKMESFIPFINPPIHCIEDCKQSCDNSNRKSLMNPNCDIICPPKCRRSNNPYNENLTHYS